eukprot:COSAG01_NODE_8552_length_2744_cov_8.662382_4_plen_43_part_01
MLCAAVACCPPPLGCWGVRGSAWPPPPPLLPSPPLRSAPLGRR